MAVATDRISRFHSRREAQPAERRLNLVELTMRLSADHAIHVSRDAGVGLERGLDDERDDRSADKDHPLRQRTERVQGLLQQPNRLMSRQNRYLSNTSVTSLVSRVPPMRSASTSANTACSSGSARAALGTVR